MRGNRRGCVAEKSGGYTRLSLFHWSAVKGAKDMIYNAGNKFRVMMVIRFE